jgi:hypothetical protein
MVFVSAAKVNWAENITAIANRDLIVFGFMVFILSRAWLSKKKGRDYSRSTTGTRMPP